MQLDEFCYIKQKAAWKLFTETRFKEAGVLFFEGRTDPRLLISLFPDIRGRMYERLSQNSTQIFKGLDSLIDGDALKSQTVDDISKLHFYDTHYSYLQRSLACPLWRTSASVGRAIFFCSARMSWT